MIACVGPGVFILVIPGCFFAPLLPPPNWKRCECNGDGILDISDPVCSLGFQFTGAAIPPCVGALDCNSDGTIDISDPVFLLAFLFLGGPPPAFPAVPPSGCEFFPGCPVLPGCP